MPPLPSEATVLEQSLSRIKTPPSHSGDAAVGQGVKTRLSPNGRQMIAGHPLPVYRRIAFFELQPAALS